MNPTIETIMKRRSIRKYTKADVTDEQLNTILKCGMYAPSAGNGQPWHFIVIRDRAVLDDIAEKHPHAKMLKNAPAAIAVVGDPTNERFGPYWMQDCAAAVENMLLAVEALGLGGVWLGVYPREERIKEITQILKIPTAFIPHSIISIGHPDEHKDLPERFHAERIHRNKW